MQRKFMEQKKQLVSGVSGVLITADAPPGKAVSESYQIFNRVCDAVGMIRLYS